ncbi:MAG: uridine kinase [Gammaproteobacteria bacterium]|nr:uridine kinase [Gammaproteobacteria bacterium]
MTTIIAISGPSGSGKTTLATQLQQQLPNNITSRILSEDDYYRDQSHLTFEQRITTNYDTPQAYEHELLVQHIEQLKQGQPVNVPQYCFKSHNRLAEQTAITGSDIIFVEGLMLFSNPELVSAFDISVFVDTPIDICLLRRINRDINERGRDLPGVTQQYLSTVRHALEEYILPNSDKAQWQWSQFENEQQFVELILDRLS